MGLGDVTLKYCPGLCSPYHNAWYIYHVITLQKFYQIGKQNQITQYVCPYTLTLLYLCWYHSYAKRYIACQLCCANFWRSVVVLFLPELCRWERVSFTTVVDGCLCCDPLLVPCGLISCTGVRMFLRLAHLYKFQHLSQ